MLREFEEFAMAAYVVDLAVGVIWQIESLNTPVRASPTAGPASGKPFVTNTRDPLATEQ